MQKLNKITGINGSGRRGNAFIKILNERLNNEPTMCPFRYTDE